MCCCSVDVLYLIIFLHIKFLYVFDWIWINILLYWSEYLRRRFYSRRYFLRKSIYSKTVNFNLLCLSSKAVSKWKYKNMPIYFKRKLSTSQDSALFWMSQHDKLILCSLHEIEIRQWVFNVTKSFFIHLQRKQMILPHLYLIYFQTHWQLH